MVKEKWCDITDGRTDGRGGDTNNIPAFSSESAGIITPNRLQSNVLKIILASLVFC